MTSEPRSRRQKIGQLKDKLWSDRSSFDAHWREIGDYVSPRRLRFWSSDRNRGEKRNQNIVDGTATMAARTLQSGLHAGLTSPARPWFKLTVPDPDLAEFKSVKAWLHTTTKRMQTVFSSSNLYNSLPIVYGDMGTFGTAAMAVVSDPQELLRCFVYPIGSYGLGMDYRGRVTTFIREYELSVRQVVEMFGVKPGYRAIDWSNLSARVKRAWDASQYEDPVTIVWAVLPNEEANPKRLEAK
ncbi:MAG: portal protein, partial [Bacteroidales bacterium]